MKITTIPEGSPITVDVAVFTRTIDTEHNVKELAIILKQMSDQHLAMPSVAIDAETSLEEASRQVVDEVLSEAKATPPLEPYIWQSEAGTTLRRNRHTHVGHIAIAGLIKIPQDSNLVAVRANRFITPDSFSNSAISLNIDPAESMIIMLGLASLRSINVIEWRASATTSARKRTLPILARLLPDPTRFTVADLRQAIEAVLGLPEESEAIVAQRRVSLDDRGLLDIRNFSRSALRPSFGIVSTGEMYETDGRPASLYRIPDNVLQVRPS